MPKVDIDYSNTIFYKIFCKDPAIKELYVGLTTNFVQRRHAHKQSCKNEKASNHNCKLYNTIRNAGGWDNWQMEIIAFHNCKDSYDARKMEQEYFETLGATLNSIEPLPKPKIKEVTVKEQSTLFWDQCNVDLSDWKAEGTHSHNGKHHKMVATHGLNNPETDNDSLVKVSSFFKCNICNYIATRKYNLDLHLNSIKHKNNASLANVSKNYHCQNCAKEFNDRAGLWRHKKRCSVVETIGETVVKNNASDKDELINYLMKENQEFKNLILKIVQNGICNQFTTNNTADSDQYNKIIIESVGGSGDNDAEKEEKIIRNISKNVVVDKGPSL
jgi:hypothetical protein